MSSRGFTREQAFKHYSNLITNAHDAKEAQRAMHKARGCNAVFNEEENKLQDIYCKLWGELAGKHKGGT